MQIHHINEGLRTFLTDTDEDIVILIAFQQSVKTFDPENCTEKRREHMQKAWLLMERQLGKRLWKSSGITREEVFTIELPDTRKKC